MNHSDAQQAYEEGATGYRDAVAAYAGQASSRAFTAKMVDVMSDVAQHLVHAVAERESLHGRLAERRADLVKLARMAGVGADLPPVPGDEVPAAGEPGSLDRLVFEVWRAAYSHGPASPLSAPAAARELGEQIARRFEAGQSAGQRGTPVSPGRC